MSMQLAYRLQKGKYLASSALSFINYRINM